ncbi:TPA: hypothetical protein I7122_18455 [Vibrio vulnificus]|nr:hypothetical protein [Vibrio vulnificus]
MSAGQIGASGFSYLKPVDFCQINQDVFRGRDADLQPLLGQWLEVFNLEGLHRIGYLSITTSSYISAMTLKLDVDGIVHDFDITVGSGSTAIISQTNTSSDGGLVELIFKKHCKATFQINGSSGGSAENYERYVKVLCRYVPAVVETAS